MWDLAEKADRFQYNGRWYDRAGFAALMEERLNPQPLDYRAVPLDVIAHQEDKKNKK